MTNKIVLTFAFITFCAFLAVLLYKVPRFDLAGVILLTVILGGYDLFFHDRRKKG